MCAAVLTNACDQTNMKATRTITHPISEYKLQMYIYRGCTGGKHVKCDYKRVLLC